MEVVSEFKLQKRMKLGSESPQVDAAQWESLKAGNASVFEAIFKAHYGFLLNYGLRLLKDEDEIKDCIQILFITIWERREYLGATTSIRNYLLASLRRLILKRIKNQEGRVEIDSEHFAIQTELSAEAKLILDQSDLDTLALLQGCIEKLPERQKEALYLKFYGNQSFAEIAAVMNVTTRAVYKLIYKALDGLNEEITRLRRY
jgi:RNA polymerase sigma factor (sigma-70 family)